MNLYQSHADINIKLPLGKAGYISKGITDIRISGVPDPECRRMRYPRIGIYAGTGTSHSWLWFVDMFERMGFHAVSVLDAPAVRSGRLQQMDVLAVSGGDTVAIAEALGEDGARQLAAFITGGGVYLGACAGAYLVMNSSKPHLCHFNFAAVKITNLSKRLPMCHGMPHKFSIAYGCDHIFHPVREAVGLRLTGAPPFSGEPALLAPLYGGPGMLAPPEAQVLARYDHFTDKTVFLVDKDLAEETLISTAAALRVPMGNGQMYLFGPHFEHPHYPRANRLVADAVYRDSRRNPDGCSPVAEDGQLLSASESANLIHSLRRELSNSRIVAAGLEMLPVRWLIGAKMYEPEKIRVFLDAMWRRLKPLEKRDRIWARAGAPDLLMADACETTALLRRLKNEIDQESVTDPIARTLFNLLHRNTMRFFELYFQTISNNLTPIGAKIESSYPPKRFS
ncbi:MAG: BPL-N domain-containing protein [Desulfobacterales bacterium]|nr:BPL-N domain-containing protein [Desulfobacterales bacterium]